MVLDRAPQNLRGAGRRWLRRTVAVLGLGLAMENLWAGQAGLLTAYTHTAWTAADGAPADIQAIAQTRDGWLWISTQTGLYRFDGSSFVRMDSVNGAPLLSTTVLPIHAPPDGGLWVGYRFGGVSFFKDGRVTHYRVADGFPPGAAMSFARAPDGKLWATSSLGLACLENGHWRRVGAEAGFDPHPGAVRQVLFDRDGTQWVSTAAGVYYRRRGEPRFSLARPTTVELWSIAEGPDGVIWASDGKDGNYRLSTDGRQGRDRPRPDLPGSGMWFDRSGAMWILRQSSVEKMPPSLIPDPHLRITLAQGLSGNSPQTFHEDREGNIWIGTAKGLDRFHPNRLQPLPGTEATYHPVLALDRHDELWVGDWGTGTFRFDAQGRLGERLDLNYQAAAAGNDGVVRLGTQSGIWWRQDKQSRLIASPPDMIRDGAQIRALAQDADGAWWAAFFNKGIHIYRDGRWRAARALYPMLPEERPMSIAADARGRLWIGYLHDQLALVQHGAVRVYGAQDGLELGNVLSFYSKRGHDWVGGETGVARFDGKRFVTLRAADGNKFLGVNGIVENAAGELWLHGYDGVFRIAAEQVRAVLDGQRTAVDYELFDAREGLSGSTAPVGPFPSMVEAASGRLWISTPSNVVQIDPAHVRRNLRPPPVELRTLEADGKPYALAGRLQLPQGTASLHLGFAAAALSRSRHAVFRYRLEGVDQDWQDARGRRDAFYTNLGPGKYRFQVIAANEDMVWNRDGATVELDIPPRFVQTMTFRVLCVLALLAMLYAAFRWQLQQRVRVIAARMQARQEERERMAHTLHDTLLQGVQGTVLLMDAATQELAHDSAARGTLETAVSYLEDVLVAGRDELMGLRSAIGGRRCLADALEAVGRNLAQGLPASFTLEVQGQQWPMEEQALDHLFAIGREGIANAFRHAGARHIALDLVFAQADVSMTVRDDGKGFDAGGMAAGTGQRHWGLANMRERAHKLGATLSITTGAGQGTAIRLEWHDPRRAGQATRDRSVMMPL